MPDRDKVIRHITAELCIARTCKKDFASVDIDMLSDALDLLKEQEPVKPVQHLVYTTKGWFCGACDGRLNRLGKYCSFCGRAVKWK